MSKWSSASALTDFNVCVCVCVCVRACVLCPEQHECKKNQP